MTKEYRHQYYLKHKEKLLEQNKQYRKNNKEKIASKKKQWYQDNKEKLTETYKQYYLDNKEKIDERHKLYYQTPIGRGNALATAYGNEDKKYNRGICDITGQWIVDNVFSGQRCFYCKETDWSKLGCDRIDNSKPHTQDNVVPCCKSCNEKRGSKSFEEFCKEMLVSV